MPDENDNCVVCGVLYRYRQGEQWRLQANGWICSPDCAKQYESKGKDDDRKDY